MDLELFRNEQSYSDQELWDEYLKYRIATNTEGMKAPYVAHLTLITTEILKRYFGEKGIYDSDNKEVNYILNGAFMKTTVMRDFKVYDMKLGNPVLVATISDFDIMVAFCRTLEDFEDNYKVYNSRGDDVTDLIRGNGNE